MEKASSRIPKLTFGFRKSSKNNGTISEGNSPRGGGLTPGQARSITPTGLHSAPGSSNTSPNLSRSKSLRVPRAVQHGLKSSSSSALLEEEYGGDVRDNLTSHSSASLSERNRNHNSREFVDHTPARGKEAAGSFVPRPRSKTIGSASRRGVNRHSRSVSPSKIIGGEEEEESVDRDSLEVGVAGWGRAEPFELRALPKGKPYPEIADYPLIIIRP